MEYMWQLVTNHMADKRNMGLHLRSPKPPRKARKTSNKLVLISPSTLENYAEYEPSEILNVDEAPSTSTCLPRVFGSVEDGGTRNGCGTRRSVRGG
ncbi:hypothetical protein GQ600_27907 [Phytophthora cactorum]|nr:hypothetical protein GQ600_27907 [Phytophthora cactorum]